MDLTKEYISSLQPDRPKDAHKGAFGKVLVIAGSENFPGAAYLCCAAAYKVGAGLVSLVTKGQVKIIVSRKLPELIFLSFSEAIKKLTEYDVLLFGPGLGQKEDKVIFIKKLLKKNLPKTVIDGDGLNILSKIDKWWDTINGEVILTPHPGEMARLTGLSVDEIQKRRTQVAQQFSKKWKKILVLKGANTVVASPGGEVVISPFANPALATAGTGDVLAGMIAGMLAQRLKSFEAASVGVYLHGLSGEILKEKFGDAGGLASDLLPLIPKVLLNIAKHRVS